MRKFNCDICGIDTSQYKLRTLYRQYAPDDIEDACDDCYNEIINAISIIDKAMSPIKQSWVRKIVSKLQRKHYVPDR